MKDILEKRKAEEVSSSALKYAIEDQENKKKNIRLKFPAEDINKLLEILLPQYFGSVVNSIKTALWQIDPTWEKGQATVFYRHFRVYLFCSLFTQRFSLVNARFSIFQEDKVLEKILEASQHLSDYEKSAFYGEVMSEYILRCPKERFPSWAESYINKQSFIVIGKLHYNIIMTIHY